MMLRRNLLVGAFLFSASYASGVSLPKDFTIPENTYSPSKHFCFSAPTNDLFAVNLDAGVHNCLIDAWSGTTIATVDGQPGCVTEEKGGILTPWWSKDESTVFWSTINRGQQGALVILKMDQGGHLAWQLDLMAACRDEATKQIKTFRPEEFKTLATKSTDQSPEPLEVELEPLPDFFSGKTAEPLKLPLEFRVQVSGPGHLDLIMEGQVDEAGEVSFSEPRISEI